jgi:E3 ubiquitin-protein ligase HUWE1
LISRLKECQTNDDLLTAIKSIKTWTFGKCELYHWVDVLDRFDGILLEAAEKQNTETWILACDNVDNEHVSGFRFSFRGVAPKYKSLTILPFQLKECTLHVLRFTTMLVEHSFSRHLYNSIEHLINLLISIDLELVLEVLHLLYMFSKRSNYLTRMSGTLRTHLNKRLTYLAEVIYYLILPCNLVTTTILFQLFSTELGRKRSWVRPG